MDAKTEELRALGALVKIMGMFTEDARSKFFADSLPGRRATFRVNESLIDCMRKAIAELRPGLVARIETDLWICENRIALRRKQLSYPPAP